MLETAEHVLDLIIHYSILVLEFVGTALVLYKSVAAVADLFRGRLRQVHKCLTAGITTGLSFLIASEVLKTIIHRDWNSIGMTCAILLMRAGISVLVHWESKAGASEEE